MWGGYCFHPDSSIKTKKISLEVILMMRSEGFFFHLTLMGQGVYSRIIISKEGVANGWIKLNKDRF